MPFSAARTPLTIIFRGAGSCAGFRRVQVVHEDIMWWMQCLSFRAPGSRVILVANKCDASLNDSVEIAERIEERATELLDSWNSSRGLPGRSGGGAKRLTILPGVSRVSCVAGSSPEAYGLTALTARIRGQAATSTAVPPAWALALDFIGALRAGKDPIRAAREKLQLPTTGTGEVNSRCSPFVSKVELSRQWRGVVDNVRDEAPAAAAVNTDGALDGALWIRCVVSETPNLEGVASSALRHLCFPPP